jgi:hypothetical protein
LASAAQQLDRVLAAERGAEQVALSLGQRERVGALIGEVEALKTDLDQHADARARALLASNTNWIGRVKARLNAQPAAPQRRLSWEPALREARSAVRAAADCLATLGASLPETGSEAELVEDVRGLLHRHRSALNAELVKWKADGGGLMT